MKLLRYMLIIGCVALFKQNTNGQGCYNFHSTRSCVSRPEDGFKTYGQSESALLLKDSTVTLPVIFYGNKDYVVTVCTERGFFPVHFVIRNTETGKVFYDNMEDNYFESVGFTVQHPRKCVFEVTLLAKDVEPSDFGDSQACVGINIQWRRAGKIGFTK